MSIKSASLASSQEVFHVQIEPYLGGFIVNYQCGKKGRTLRTGTKTRKEVTIEQATAIYHATISDQVGKGLALLSTKNAARKAKPIPNPAFAKSAPKSDLPMLLNPIEDATRVVALIQNGEWIMQEKKDGRHQTILRKGNNISSLNKYGKEVPLLAEVAFAVLRLISRLPADFILDGVMVNNVFFPFDITRYTGVDLRTQPLEKRLSILNALLDTVPSPFIGRISFAHSTQEKVALCQKITDEGGKGIVFKKLSAPYSAGRPSAGGNALGYNLPREAAIDLPIVEQVPPPRPTPKQSASDAAKKAAATRKANAPAKPEPVREPVTMNAAHKAWITRRAKAAANATA